MNFLSSISQPLVLAAVVVMVLMMAQILYRLRRLENSSGGQSSHDEGKGVFAPSKGILTAIINALKGWTDVFALGPTYFAEKSVVQELYAMLMHGKEVSDETKLKLAQGRVRVLNFANLINPFKPWNPRKAQDVMGEVNEFLAQMKEQVESWNDGAFTASRFSQYAIAAYWLIVAKGAATLFFMGFKDAIPHSFQVSRLTASIAFKNLRGNPLEVLAAAIVGFYHDPKLHPDLDLGKLNLATHPIIAAALAYFILRDPDVVEALQKCMLYTPRELQSVREALGDGSEPMPKWKVALTACKIVLHNAVALVDQFAGFLINRLRNNLKRLKNFRAGVVDALAINNDSRFVQMFVIMPAFLKYIVALFGVGLSNILKTVMEARLESAAQNVAPPKLPDHIHGLLSQIKLPTGLNGITEWFWVASLKVAGITCADPRELFARLLDGDDIGIDKQQMLKLKIELSGITESSFKSVLEKAKIDHNNPMQLLTQLMSGEDTGLPSDKLAALKGAVPINPVLLSIDITADLLLHHHQEVRASGRVPAEALVVADPMMLSPHKVCEYYQEDVVFRLTSFDTSYQDNNRLLSPTAKPMGMRWQRAVLLSVVHAIDNLRGTTHMDDFLAQNRNASLTEDVFALRTMIVNRALWGQFANITGWSATTPEMKTILLAMEASYNKLVRQYRKAAYACLDGASLDKFEIVPEQALPKAA